MTVPTGLITRWRPSNHDEYPGTQKKRKKQIKIKKEETLLILRAYLSHPTNWLDILADIRQNKDQLPEDALKHYRTDGEKQLKTRMSSKIGGLISQNPAEINDPDIREALHAVQRLERRLLRPDDVAKPQLGAAERDQIRRLNQGHRGQVVAAEMQQPLQGQALRDLNRGINPGQNGPPDQQPQPRPVPRELQPGPAPRELHNGGRRAPGEQRRDVRAQAANALSSSSEDDNTDARQRPRQNNRQRKRPLAELIRENHELYNRFLKRKVPKLLRELGISSSDNE